MKKHKERSFNTVLVEERGAFFVLFDPKKVVSGSLFGCFAERERERERDRERESRDKKHSSSNLSKKERKSC